MGKGYLGWEDARALLRLAGEAREIGLGSQAARDHLVQGAMALVHAVVGVFVMDPSFRPGGKGPLGHVTVVSDRPAVGFVEPLLSRGREQNLLLSGLIQRTAGARAPRGECVASHRAEMVNQRRWHDSEFVSEYLYPARYDDWLACVSPTGEPNEVSGLAFIRAWGDRPFSEGERDLVQLLHEECGAMLTPRPASAQRPALPPRIEQTLRHLLTGAQDKEIAAALGISVHTTREYVKRILRAYGASSRAQLIARLAAEAAS